MKRMFDSNKSDFLNMTPKKMKESIELTNGRTICCEIECDKQSLVDGVSNVELATSMSADILLLASFDTNNPYIDGIPKDFLQPPVFINIKNFIGRPIGVNLIVTKEIENDSHSCQFFNLKNVERIVSEGADIIFLIKRMSSGATTETVDNAVKAIYKRFGDDIMIICTTEAKDSPPREKIILSNYLDTHEKYLQSGAMGIGVPLPGCKKGWDNDETKIIIDKVHKNDGLLWLILTQSVEGASINVIQNLALTATKLGADVHRLDYAGLSGIADPLNIMEYSFTIRGKRHTFRRMAMSMMRN